MKSKKIILFTLIAVASASSTYGSPGGGSWQGGSSVPSTRSSQGSWSSNGDLNRNGAESNGWSGVYRYGINKGADGYSSQGSWPSEQGSSNSPYSGNSYNSNGGWGGGSSGWNDANSRSNGWNSANSRTNNGWQSSGW